MVARLAGSAYNLEFLVVSLRQRDFFSTSASLEWASG